LRKAYMQKYVEKELVIANDINTGADVAASHFVRRPCCFMESTYHRQFAFRTCFL